LRRLMHKTGKSSRHENQDLNVTLKTMKAELERVEDENKSNRKRGLEIVCHIETLFCLT